MSQDFSGQSAPLLNSHSGIMKTPGEECTLRRLLFFDWDAATAKWPTGQYYMGLQSLRPVAGAESTHMRTLDPTHSQVSYSFSGPCKISHSGQVSWSRDGNQSIY